jgi:surface antigen
MAPGSISRHLRGAAAVAAVCLGLSAALAPIGAAADEFDDLSVIVPAVNDALETRRTGTSVPWSNPATGGAGTISILRTYYRADGVPCREYERTTERPGSGASVVLGVGCRVGPNFWQLEEDAEREAETETAARVAEEGPLDVSAPAEAAEEPAAATSEDPAEDELVVAASEPESEAIEEPVILIGSIPTMSDE